MNLTGSGCFTNEGDQVVLDFGKSVVVVYHKHVSLAGLAADASQLGHIHVGHSDHKHTVACRRKTQTHKNKQRPLLSLQQKPAAGINTRVY